ncbi:alpha/beta hydrolase [Halobacteriales archaeon QS_3_64_16]|nr:MAG: alpha/beta hydrolase [Halobacteriales archaeon QS_3_64_16]
MDTAAHHGRETAYRVVDTEGPRLCYVHGSGADHRLWVQQYATGGTALDLSGHGESEDIDADPGYEALSAYADDVLAVAEATDSNVLVGNSLGGAVCLHALLERETDIEALVLAGSGAKLGVLSRLRDWLDEDFERAISFLHEPDTLFHDPGALGSDTDGTSETNGNDSIERSKATMRATGREVTQRDFLSCHHFDVRDRLDEITIPTLALCGEYDRLTPPEYHQYLAAEIPEARREVLPDAAHLAMLERPEQFEGAVARFLEEHLD